MRATPPTRRSTSRATSPSSSPASTCSSTAAAASAAPRASADRSVAMRTHPRVSLSMLSQWNWTVDEDLDYFDREGVEVIGVSLAKLQDGGGWEKFAPRIRDGGYRVANLIGLGPFQLSDSSAWSAQRDRVRDALDAAEAVGAECIVLTTGPAGQLPWEDAAEAAADAFGPLLDDAAARGLSLAFEHTNGLRVDIGFLHTLRDAIDFARGLGVGVCMEINACWAERGLDDTIRNGVDTITIVQLSDYAIGTKCTPHRLVPGDGDIPMERIVGQVLAAGYEGAFDLELIGPRIDEEGYESSSTRAVEYVGDLLRNLGAGAVRRERSGRRGGGRGRPARRAVAARRATAGAGLPRATCRRARAGARPLARVPSRRRRRPPQSRAHPRPSPRRGTATRSS